MQVTYASTEAKEAIRNKARPFVILHCCAKRVSENKSAHCRAPSAWSKSQGRRMQLAWVAVTVCTMGIKLGVVSINWAAFRVSRLPLRHYLDVNQMAGIAKAH